MLFIWVVILFTYLRFPAALSPEQFARLPIKMLAPPIGAVCGIVTLSAIAMKTSPSMARGIPCRRSRRFS
jgi:L-asparagine transporter-like permease